MNDTVNFIAIDELSTKIESGEVLVAEILPLKYFESGHLPGAQHLPLEGFETQAKSVAPNKTAEIVVYCAGPTCSNSDIAARKLAEMGYANVRVFRGGKSEWKDTGRALVGGAA